MRRLSWFAVGAFCAAIGALHGGTAWASVTIGQLAPGNPPPIQCSVGPFDFIQPTVTSGTAYVVPPLPFGGAITSWSTNAAAGPGQMLSFKVFRKIGDPATYEVIGHDTRALAPSTINTFAVNIPVQPGDVIGDNDENASTAPNACFFSAPGESRWARSGDLADGDSGAFGGPFPNFRLNVSAVVTPSTVVNPSNSFTLGATTRNKKRGTAYITVNVPGPGTLALSGNGVKAQTASQRGPVAAKTVSGPGAVKLLVEAIGRKKRNLTQKGKVKVNLAVTYTPIGGDPRTQSVKVKLLRKR